MFDGNNYVNIHVFGNNALWILLLRCAFLFHIMFKQRINCISFVTKYGEDSSDAEFQVISTILHWEYL